MASFPLGKIKCTTCGRFVNRYQGAYRRLINMGYSREKALHALGIKRYCCRMHLENPDIMKLDLTPNEVENIKNELGDRKGTQVIDAMYKSDPYDERDPHSLVNTVGTWRIISSILPNIEVPQFVKDIEAEQLRVSHERIEKAKRENKYVETFKGEERIYDVKTGKRVDSKGLTSVIIWPKMLNDTVEEVRNENKKKLLPVSSRERTRRPVGIFDVGVKAREFARKKVGGAIPTIVAPPNYERAAIKVVDKDAKGDNIYLSESGIWPARGKSEKVEVLFVGEKGEIPKGYEEVYVSRTSLVYIPDNVKEYTAR